MNFEWKSTFKSKWKRFWIISLKKGTKIEVTKHVLLADEPSVSAYSLQLELFGHPLRYLNAMKCAYVGFSPSKQQSFLSKISFNSCLMGLDQLYTGRAGVGNKIRNLSQCVPRAWPSGNGTSGAQNYWRNLFFLSIKRLISSLCLFLLLQFTFSLLQFCCVSLYSLLKFFKL